MKLDSIKSAFDLSQVSRKGNNLDLREFKSLSNEEERAIFKEFPQGRNSKLELYLSNGISRTEQPGAKGSKLDYRI